jgi:beta propeller domain-containing protein
MAIRPGGFVLLAAALLAGCGGGGSSSATSEAAPKPWALRATTDAGLTAYFRDALGPSAKLVLPTDPGGVLAGGVAGSSPPVAPPLGDVFSGTTLQESGVDEADLIKSDGLHVFSLDPADATGRARGVLRRQRLVAGSPDAALAPVDSLAVPFSANVRGTGLYLDGDRKQLAAVGEGGTGGGIYDTWFMPWYWGGGVTEVALIDTADATKMQTRRTLRMTARLIGSRRVGSTLYLVMRSYAQVPGLDRSWPVAKTASNQALLDSLQAQQLLPTLSVDGGAAQPLVQASACLVQEQNTARSPDVITVVGIDLASPTHRHAARCFAGGTEAFYMAEQSLYLATTRYAYAYSGAIPIYGEQTSTDVHKFALDGLDIAYRGSGNVTGHLGFDQARKSFRMGEHNAALRVITQTQPTWGGWVGLPVIGAATTTATATTTTATAAIESPGHLTILAETAGALAVMGELPNAARPQPLGKPGEQLYASRFLGARGYLVTYRLTDPLYVLDLSNPADPKIAGELQVDGYSDYLFPVGETLLLGVGKDAIADGTSGDGRFAWYQGVKVSLIDVSDPARPREAARSVIGRRGTDATVLHNHHGIALQALGNTVRISLSVRVHETPQPSGTGAPMDYFLFTRTELQRFELDVSGRTLTARPALASSVAGQRGIGDDRSLLWNDQVHWYQNGTWLSAGW